jgi:hypothetical protein
LNLVQMSKDPTWMEGSLTVYHWLQLRLLLSIAFVGTAARPVATPVAVVLESDPPAVLFK